MFSKEGGLKEPLSLYSWTGEMSQHSPPSRKGNIRKDLSPAWPGPPSPVQGPHVCLINPQVKSPILFTQRRINLGPWAECQRSERDNFTLMVLLPLCSPGIPRVLLRREPGPGHHSQVDTAAVVETAFVCRSLNPPPGHPGSTEPHVMRVSRQTLVIRAMQKIKSKLRDKQWNKSLHRVITLPPLWGDVNPLVNPY